MTDANDIPLSDEWHDAVFVDNPVPMALCEPGSLRILAINTAMETTYGYSRDKLRGAGLATLFRSGPIHCEERHSGAKQSRSRSAGTYRIQCPDNSTRYAAVTQLPVNLGGREITLAVLQEVTRQVHAETQLRETQDELHQAQSLASIGPWTWDAKTDSYDSSSPEAFRIFGFDLRNAPFSTERLCTCIHPDDRERAREAWQKALSEPDYKFDIHIRIVRPSGEVRFIHSMAETKRRENGSVAELVGIVQDETERMRAEEEIKRLAYYDNITSLPNRNLFDIRFKKRLAELPADRNKIALLIVNLVHFRDVNLTLGHTNGDVLLRLVAERISEVIRDSDTAARVGSRFPVMLVDVDEEQARHYAQEIQRALEKPFSFGGISYEICAHIGMAISPQHGLHQSTLLRKADVALYQAAQNGKNLAVYDSRMDPHTSERLSLIGEFRKAVESHHIHLFCQPKVDMRSREVVGAEALARWCHPTRGTIPPDIFIPLIESTDLIHVLTQHMLLLSVEQCLTWQRAGVILPLAVNLSTRDVAALNLSGQLHNLLERHGAAATSLELEITESTIMRNPTVSIAELQRLSGMGFRLYVDDFGTGYSSLSYLTTLPVNVIKIDHGFTMQMVRDSRIAAIVRSTIQLAHDLGMKVVAEGTADREIWDALAQINCDEAQGFFISPPIPADSFIPWLESSQYSLPARSQVAAH